MLTLLTALSCQYIYIAAKNGVFVSKATQRVAFEGQMLYTRGWGAGITHTYIQHLSHRGWPLARNPCNVLGVTKTVKSCFLFSAAKHSKQFNSFSYLDIRVSRNHKIFKCFTWCSRYGDSVVQCCIIIVRYFFHVYAVRQSSYRPNAQLAARLSATHSDSVSLSIRLKNIKFQTGRYRCDIWRVQMQDVNMYYNILNLITD